MRTKVRLIAFGSLGGILLSTLRAPLGLDLLTASAVEGLTAFTFRAAALLVLAMAIVNARVLRAGVPTLLLVASLGLGYALHGLWLDSLAPLGTRFEFGLALVGLFVAMHISARIDPEPDAKLAPESSDEQLAENASGPKFIEQLGLVFAGAAVAIAFESVARPLRQLGLGLAEDDTAYGVGLFIFALLGAAAFGRCFPLERHGKTIAALGVGAAVLACSLGTARLHQFENATSLTSFIQNIGSLLIFASGPPTIFKIDISHLGTWRADLLLAGSCLLLPGMLLGIAVRGARHSKSLASLLIGAAIGTLCYALILRQTAKPLILADLAETTHFAEILGLAAYTAAAGALLVAFGTGKSGARSIGIAGAIAIAVTPSFLTPKDAWLFSPWDQSPSVEPLLVIDSDAGLLTVEPARQNLTVTLNRDRMTPTPWEEQADEERIRRSLELISTVDGTPRVLFVGQLTPSRALAFEHGRTVDLEVTAAWHRHMAALDEVLFRDWERTPPGTRVGMHEARKALDRGDYDLVIIPPTLGRRLPTLPAQFDSAPAGAPRSHGWSVPDGTIAVVWLDTAAELASTDLNGRIIISTLPFEEPCIGLVLGNPAEAGTLVAGAGRAVAPSGLAILRSRAYQRQHRSRSQLFARLAQNSEGGPDEAWLKALALHYGSQIEISPFGNWAQGIDVGRDMLSELRTAALAEGELNPDVRRFWEQIAKVLREGRIPDLILEFVKPVAEARAPWIELDRAVTAAYMEFDMVAEVEQRLPALIANAPYSIEIILMCAAWEESHDRDAKALEYLRRADGIQPGRPDLQFQIALIAHRTGAEDAEALVRRALEYYSDDEELLGLLESFP